MGKASQDLRAEARETDRATCSTLAHLKTKPKGKAKLLLELLLLIVGCKVVGQSLGGPQGRSARNRQGNLQYSCTPENEFQRKSEVFVELLLFIVGCEVVGQSLRRPQGGS